MNNRYLMDRASRRNMSQNQGRGQGQRMDGHYPHYPRKTMREMERMQMQQYPQQYPMDMRYGQPMPKDYNYGNTERDSRYNDRNYSMPMDARYDMAYQQYRQPSRPMDFAMYGYGVGGIMPMNYAQKDYDYGYDYASEEKEWKEHLKKWCEELKRYDRFNMPKEQVIQNAKQMGIEFDKYNEEEFLTTYYMVMSDYPSIANEPHTYISLAKDWLEDKDSKLKGSEKLCAYYYEVIKGGEED